MKYFAKIEDPTKLGEKALAVLTQGEQFEVEEFTEGGARLVGFRGAVPLDGLTFVDEKGKKYTPKKA